MAVSTLSDTSPEALRVLIDCYRRMPLERRWHLVGDSLRFGRQLHAWGMQIRHSGADESDIQRDWLQMHFGIGPWSDPSCELRPREGAIGQQQILFDGMQALERTGIRAVVGGAIASSVFGVPRYTRDADLLVEPFAGRESKLIGQFCDDYVLDATAIEQANAQHGSFAVIHMPSGFKLDVFVLAPTPYHRQMIDRAEHKVRLGADVPHFNLLSPEDAALTKLVWFRRTGERSDCQWSDILGVLRVQAGNLDEAYLDQWAAELNVADLLAKARADAIV